MKIIFREDVIIIFLKKENINNIDFNSKSVIEEYIKQLLTNLKRIINIDLYGLYTLNIFLDKYYGAVVEIDKVDNDIYYLNDIIDMKINIIETEFLYEIDLLKIDKSKYDIYLYKDKIFLKIKKDLDNQEFMRLIENSNIIYDDENIRFSSKKI